MVFFISAPAEPWHQDLRDQRRCQTSLAHNVWPPRSPQIKMTRSFYKIYIFNKNVLKAVKMCECEGIFQNSVGITYLELIEV